MRDEYKVFNAEIGTTFFTLRMTPSALEIFEITFLWCDVHDSVESSVMPRKLKSSTISIGSPLIERLSGSDTDATFLFRKIIHLVFDTFSESLLTQSQSDTFVNFSSLILLLMA